jgi:hypothetical protein
MSNLSDFEKKLYNCYLKNFRSGEPYRPRKDFSNVHPNVIAALNKISSFLNRYSHIKYEEYFEAPAFLYKNDKYPPLNSFTSRAALKNYALYQKQKEDRNPEIQFEEIKNSFRFIGLFCIGNKIPTSKYLSHKTGYMYSWLNHYREHRVNPYSLFEFGSVIQALEQIPKDELNLFAQNLQENIVAYHKRYQNSPKTKQYCKQLNEKIKNFVEKELTNSSSMLIS